MAYPKVNRSFLHVLLWAVLWAFTLFLVYRFLSTVATVALSITVGLLLAVALSGPVEALRRRKVPRTLALALIVFGVLVLLGISGFLLGTTLADQASRLASSLPEALSNLSREVERLASRFGVPVPEGGGLSPSSLSGSAGKALGGAAGVFGSAASALVGLVVVLFLALYLVANPEPMVDWLVRLFPPNRRPRTREVLSSLRTGLLDWLKGQLAAMAVIGVLWTVALLLIGVPGALFLGIFAGLAAFVPYIGPLIGLVPAFVLAFAAGPLSALLVLVAYVAIQGAESYLITPLIMERAASIHPATVIAVVTVLGAAFGALGALLAVPTAVVTGVLINELWFQRLEKTDR